MMIETTEAVPTETAVIVPVPELEVAVADHRRRLDVAATWGVGAHVSVIYPFAAPADVDAALIARLAVALRSVDAFPLSSHALSGSATTCCGWRRSPRSRSGT